MVDPTQTQEVVRKALYGLKVFIDNIVQLYESANSSVASIQSEFVPDEVTQARPIIQTDQLDTVLHEPVSVPTLLSTTHIKQMKKSDLISLATAWGIDVVGMKGRAAFIDAILTVQEASGQKANEPNVGVSKNAIKIPTIFTREELLAMSGSSVRVVADSLDVELESGITKKEAIEEILAAQISEKISGLASEVDDDNWDDDDDSDSTQSDTPTASTDDDDWEEDDSDSDSDSVQPDASEVDDDDWDDESDSTSEEEATPVSKEDKSKEEDDDDWDDDEADDDDIPF